LIRRILRKNVKAMKYWVQPYVNKIELSDIVVTRELYWSSGSFRPFFFTQRRRKVLNFAPFLPASVSES
jgi:hypothetical protein